MSGPRPFEVRHLAGLGWVPFGLDPRFDGLTFESADYCRGWFAARTRDWACGVAWEDAGDRLIGRWVPVDPNAPGQPPVPGGLIGSAGVPASGNTHRPYTPGPIPTRSKP